MVCRGFKNGYPKNDMLKKIRLHAQNMIIMAHSISNIVQHYLHVCAHSNVEGGVLEELYNHSISIMSIFTLTMNKILT